MRGLVAVALGASLMVTGCKKTVEGENQAWQRNVQRINELAAVYPGFANALHAQEKQAEDAMTAAPAATGSPAGATGAPQAKVQWKCSYCNHMNDDSRQKCENCGAPRSAAKPTQPPKKK